MNLLKKDYELILSDNVFINEKYKNKTLPTMASDIFDDGTISYVMNEHGYRSNSFIDKSDYNILTLGCSWTMGIGVNNDDIWASIITKKIKEQLQDKKVKLFNYGIYGVSTSFTAKNFYKILETEIVPDLVLIMWPGFSRRDYIKSDGSFKKVGGFRLAHERDVIWKNEDEDINFIELRNDYQDLMEFWESYKFVEATAKLKNVKVIHTVAGYYYEIFDILKSNLDKTIDYDNFYLPVDCYKTDFAARDKHHPGVDWHKNFSNNFFNFFKQKI